jgi:hypothetical protein
MEAIHSSETSVLTRSTWCNIPEDGILHSLCRENHKFYWILRLIDPAVWTWGDGGTVRTMKEWSRYHLVEFGYFVVVTMNVMVIWVLILCLSEKQQLCHLLLFLGLMYSSALKMEAVYYCKLPDFFQTTQYYDHRYFRFSRYHLIECA